MKTKTLIWSSALILSLFLIWLLPAGSIISSSQQVNTAQNNQLNDPFVSGSNLHVTQGAAAGYVADKQCENCHAGHTESYQHIGMSKSFKRPAITHFIESFDQAPYFHKPSERYYQMQQNGDDLQFIRYQLDDQQQPINLFKRKVDYIIGSGNTTRSYLYQTENGEMFQLPLGWYSQTQQWAMAPGFDKPKHAGVTRPIQRQCLFCHNALPDVATDSDLHWQPHFFPKTLPQGIGCQRCHGPGAKHINTVLAPDTTLDKIKAAIVNPAKLPVQQRDSVCFQCHLLPSVALTGIRKFDRPDYSFRPGDDIFDYIAHVDITESDKSQDERFEINHHAYRLRKSKCFTQSEGALTCISCHNPHKKVAASAKTEHYQNVCLSCHTEPHPVSAIANTKINDDDCVSCHMPKRRTQDVVHVVMTDHKIQRQLTDPQPLTTLKETEPTITGIEFLLSDKAPKDAVGEVYKAVTLLRTTPTANYVDYLKMMLAQSKIQDIQPYFDLAQGQLTLQRYDEVLTTTSWLLSREPDNFRVKQWRGTAFIGLNKLDEAMAIFEPLVAQQPKVAEIQFNFALLLYAKQNYHLAKDYLAKTLKLRDTMPQAWFYQGLVNIHLNNKQAAINDFISVLAIDPSYTRAYLELSKLYQQEGDAVAAKRYRLHGIKNAREPLLLNEIQ
ncbi:tetratricopeptide repeat protein [Algibacillus agarilyticus]|uniref:tetratricopeptide repeat protein n=1 Tax=Algibacillus agarilyticus TaxID=2234133 RepID=UPI000DD0CC92|nr:tetratricopeptide repeat protein [Algibacillus agarilyticus]